MTRARTIAIFAATTLVLGACQGGAGSNTPPLVEGHVESVTVSIETASAPDGFRQTFTDQLRAWTGKCAEGDRALHLEVYVTHFSETDGLTGFLAGNPRSMRGAIRIYDDSEKLLLDSDFSSSRLEGSSVSQMVGSEREGEDLASFAAAEICKDLFD